MAEMVILGCSAQREVSGETGELQQNRRTRSSVHTREDRSGQVATSKEAKQSARVCRKAPHRVHGMECVARWNWRRALALARAQVTVYVPTAGCGAYFACWSRLLAAIDAQSNGRRQSI
jgi:hypothetical protein